MRPRTLLIGGIVVIIAGVVIISMLGLMPGFNIFDTISGTDTPPDSDYCGFSDGQIIDFLEILAGKDLNNEQALGFVQGLNMVACGTDSKTHSEIVSYYKTLYASDWYLLGEGDYSGSGWDATSVVWGNAPTLGDSTLCKAISTGSGISIKEYYDYNTITITSSGSRITYVAFALWLGS